MCAMKKEPSHVTLSFLIFACGVEDRIEFKISRTLRPIDKG